MKGLTLTLGCLLFLTNSAHADKAGNGDGGPATIPTEPFTYSCEAELHGYGPDAVNGRIRYAEDFIEGKGSFELSSDQIGKGLISLRNFGLIYPDREFWHLTTRNIGPWTRSMRSSESIDLVTNPPLVNPEQEIRFEFKKFGGHWHTRLWEEVKVCKKIETPPSLPSGFPDWGKSKPGLSATSEDYGNFIVGERLRVDSTVMRGDNSNCLDKNQEMISTQMTVTCVRTK